jgi:bifunctional N6-L-threonylcarbamoyladenine synthase / protein kinase Bud32
MSVEKVCCGSEAHILRYRDVAIKARVSKGYRIREIDEEIIKLRTRHEERILRRLEGSGLTPRLVDKRELPKEVRKELSEMMEGAGYPIEHVVCLEWIEGKALLTEGGDRSLIVELGRVLGRLHRMDVVHGDLTPSNVIVAGGSLKVIDLGLAKVSAKDEDKAVDIYLAEKALAACEMNFSGIVEGYRESGCASVLERTEVVRGRGRKREEQAFG